MTKPWMKFYPSDWRSDPALRMCPMAARGLWMEMLCIMHEAEPYGHLVVKGVQMTDVALARIAGISLKECRNSLATLRQLGVFSVSDEGVIYSRRMTRDAAKALADKENGKKGGNPGLTGGVNPQDKAQKPEARGQSSELEPIQPPVLNPEAVEADKAAAASRSAGQRGPYFFEAGPIRLSEADFRKWEQTFTELALASELRGLEAWAGRHGKNWFLPVQSLLATKNREARSLREAGRLTAEAVAKAQVEAGQHRKRGYLLV